MTKKVAKEENRRGGPRRIDYVLLDEVKPAKRNMKEHALSTITDSVERFGYVETMVRDDRTGRLVAGHGRLETLQNLQKAGKPPPDGVKLEKGKWLVPVQAGWSSRSDDEAEAYLIASNRLVELGGWDREGLEETLMGLANRGGVEALLGTGYTGADVDAILAGLTNTSATAGAGDEALIPLPTSTHFVRGDLIALGPHRLICGDCRVRADVEKLLAGVRPQVIVTSPPYAAQRDYDQASGFEPIWPDAYEGWWEPLQAILASVLAERGSFFLNLKEHCDDGIRHPYVKQLLLTHVAKWGWRWVEEYAWVHGGTPKGVQRRFKNGWEPVFHLTRTRDFDFYPDGVRHRYEPMAGETEWFGSGGHPSQLGGHFAQATTAKKKALQKASADMNDQGTPGHGKAIRDLALLANDGWAYPSTALHLGKNREALGHPAAYPIELPAFFVRAFSRHGEAVFDPFMGSGSTLMAAQQWDRVAYGTELSPIYCQIIVNRWEKVTGGSHAILSRAT